MKHATKRIRRESALIASPPAFALALTLVLVLVLPLAMAACDASESDPDAAATEDAAGPSTEDGDDASDGDDEATPRPTAARGVDSVVTADGAMRAVYSAQTLSFPAAGDVIAMLVEPGDEVSAGDELGRIDLLALDVPVAAAEAELAAARDALERAQSGASVETARLEIERAKNTRWQQQILRDTTCGRTGPLASTGDCNAADAAVNVAEIGVQLAELNLETVRSTGAGEVRASQARVRQAEVSLARARSDRERGTLKAPFAGRVTEVHMLAGVQAAPGAPVITLFPSGAIYFVTTTLGERNVADVRAGADALITLNAFPDQPLDGTVTRVDPSGTTDSSGAVVYSVFIDVEDEDLQLLEGMTGRVEIEVSDD